MPPRMAWYPSSVSCSGAWESTACFLFSKFVVQRFARPARLQQAETLMSARWCDRWPLLLSLCHVCIICSNAFNFHCNHYIIFKLQIYCLSWYKLYFVNGSAATTVARLPSSGEKLASAQVQGKYLCAVQSLRALGFQEMQEFYHLCCMLESIE